MKNNNKPKITAEMLNEVLSKFTEENYPRDAQEGMRKFSLEVKEAITNSSGAIITIATILASPKLYNDVESLALTSLAVGVVIGYQLKEMQIEKIIDSV